MRKLVPVGTVFAVPLSDSEWCCGQVLAHRFPTCYMGLFDKQYPTLPTMEDVQLRNMIYAGHFFDGLIRNRRWHTVGIKEPDSRHLVFPKHKVFVAGRDYVEEWDKSARRPATGEELQFLLDETSYGAILLEQAGLYHFGLAECDEQFEQISLQSVLRSAAIRVSEGP